MAEVIYSDVIGFDNMVIAEVLKDDAENFTTGEVRKLLPAGELSKTVAQDAANKYYDNHLWSRRKNVGDTEITVSGAKIPSKELAKIMGDTVDETTGICIDDGLPKDKYYSVGYRLKYEDGTYKNVWLLKCSINRPDEAGKTEDDSTDSNNNELSIVAVTTQHVFTKTGKPAKEIYCDERDGLADYAKFFDAVVTPDTLPTKTS